MDIFNPTERQQIIPPPPPTQPATTTGATSTSSTSAGAQSSSAITINSSPTTTYSQQQQQPTSTTSKIEPNNNNVTVTIDTKQMQSELERRQQELEIKAAELAAREEALRQGGEFRRQHNWPPLPSFCPLKPCFFQDINVDIRPEFQRTVQLGYHLWIAFVFTQMLNILGAVLLITYGVPESAKNLSFGLMTFIFFVPLTYMSWFRPLYKAFKNDSSFNFMIFFFVFFMQTLIVSFWSFGLQSDGPVGLFIALKNAGVGIFLGLVLFIVTAAWMAYAVASALYLLKVHSIYRSSGASIAKARNEFTQGIISNQYVQQTVANAARQTVNQTFNAGTSGASTNNLP